MRDVFKKHTPDWSGLERRGEGSARRGNRGSKKAAAARTARIAGKKTNAFSGNRFGGCLLARCCSGSKSNAPTREQIISSYLRGNRLKRDPRRRAAGSAATMQCRRRRPMARDDETARLKPVVVAIAPPLLAEAAAAAEEHDGSGIAPGAMAACLAMCAPLGGCLERVLLVFFSFFWKEKSGKSKETFLRLSVFSSSIGE